MVSPMSAPSSSRTSAPTRTSSSLRGRHPVDHRRPELGRDGQEGHDGDVEPVGDEDRVERSARQPLDVRVVGRERSDLVRRDVTERVPGGEVPARPVANGILREPLERGHEGEAADQQGEPSGGDRHRRPELTPLTGRATHRQAQSRGDRRADGREAREEGPSHLAVRPSRGREWPRPLSTTRSTSTPAPPAPSTVRSAMSPGRGRDDGRLPSGTRTRRPPPAPWPGWCRGGRPRAR